MTSSMIVSKMPGFSLFGHPKYWTIGLITLFSVPWFYAFGWLLALIISFGEYCLLGLYVLFILWLTLVGRDA